MYTGSTNLIAAAREKGNNRTKSTFVGSLQLSTYVGLTLGLSLLVLARPLLRSIIGNDAISPEVFGAAMKYIRIRALGFPAAALIGSAQAACLGMQDIRSPLYVLLAAAVVNFLGDLLFVGSPHPWIGGAAGAAWATVISQYAAAGFFMHWLTTKKDKQLHNTTSDNTTTDKKEKWHQLFLNRFRRQHNSDIKTKTNDQDAQFNTRGYLENDIKASDLIRLPPRSIIQQYSPFFIPVTSTQIGRVSGYVAMSHVVSSSLGTFSMAAQQVIVSLFYCLCPIADSLSLTAQSFVPAIAEKPVSAERTKALSTTLWNFIKAGTLFGAVLVAAVSCFPLLSSFFTPDLYVASLVNKVVPLLIVFFSIHGLMCASEGILLGRKDLGFLGKMYATYFFVVPYFMMKVKSAALAGANVGLTTVWSVFATYQVSRVMALVGRAFWLQRKTNRETESTKNGVIPEM